MLPIVSLCGGDVLCVGWENTSINLLVFSSSSIDFCLLQNNRFVLGVFFPTENLLLFPNEILQG